jgi:hypothetical protein
MLEVPAHIPHKHIEWKLVVDVLVVVRIEVQKVADSS